MIASTPCGEMELMATENGICLCDWVDSPRHDLNLRRMARLYSPQTADSFPSCNSLSALSERDIILQTIRQLNEYFSGDRFDFTIPIDLRGTAFQEKVWHLLRGIPYGTTESYSSIALKAGTPKGVRAVANAIAANPISILVPCHRVVGANGSLTGYAGGLKNKKFLLDLEKFHYLRK